MNTNSSIFVCPEAPPFANQPGLAGARWRALCEVLDNPNPVMAGTAHA